MNRSDTRALVLLLAAFALTWFCNLDQRKLAKSDEGRYAEIPREMVASGDWLTPRLNDYKYFEKPPFNTGRPRWHTRRSGRTNGPRGYGPV